MRMLMVVIEENVNSNIYEDSHGFQHFVSITFCNPLNTPVKRDDCLLYFTDSESKEQVSLVIYQVTQLIRRDLLMRTDCTTQELYSVLCCDLNGKEIPQKRGYMCIYS